MISLKFLKDTIILTRKSIFKYSLWKKAKNNNVLILCERNTKEGTNKEV